MRVVWLRNAVVTGYAAVLTIASSLVGFVCFDQLFDDIFGEEWCLDFDASARSYLYSELCHSEASAFSAKTPIPVV